MVTALGQAGQKSVDIGETLQTGLGISHLAGYTVVRTFVKGMATAAAGNTTEQIVHAQWGIGIFAGSIDDGDFPDLGLYDGDWLAFGSLVFKNPGVALNTVLPEAAGYVDVSSKAQRRVDRIGEVPFLVVQTNRAEDYEFSFAISQLWLMP